MSHLFKQIPYISESFSFSAPRDFCAFKMLIIRTLAKKYEKREQPEKRHSTIHQSQIRHESLPQQAISELRVNYPCALHKSRLSFPLIKRLHSVFNSPKRLVHYPRLIEITEIAVRPTRHRKIARLIRQYRSRGL